MQGSSSFVNFELMETATERKLPGYSDGLRERGAQAYNGGLGHCF